MTHGHELPFAVLPFAEYIYIYICVFTFPVSFFWGVCLPFCRNKYVCYFVLLVLKGIYHYWTLLFSRELKQNGGV